MQAVIMRLSVRKAKPEDVPSILKMIRELARFESHFLKMKKVPVRATVALLRRYLFGRKRCAECLVAFCGSQPAGFALFFQDFSGYNARPGLYLEDLFVREPFRRQGVGLALMRKLGAIARQRRLERIRFLVFNVNTNALRFYQKRLGSFTLPGALVQQISGKALRTLDAGAKNAPKAAPAPVGRF
jgi:GNAT superfamily N-acetyltransferase